MSAFMVSLLLFFHSFLFVQFISAQSYKPKENVELLFAQLENSCELMTFFDNRSNKYYKYGVIGNQTWMFENLNFDYPGSLCFNDSIDYCDSYGRLYTFEMAENACPVGWKLPNSIDWQELIEFSGGIEYAGQELRSNNSRMESVDNIINTQNFSVSFGGLKSGNNANDIGGNNNEFTSLGSAGYYWINDASHIKNWSKTITFFYNQSFVYFSGSPSDSYLSVRCIKRNTTK